MRVHQRAFFLLMHFWHSRFIESRMDDWTIVTEAMASSVLAIFSICVDGCCLSMSISRARLVLITESFRRARWKNFLRFWTRSIAKYKKFRSEKDRISKCLQSVNFDMIPSPIIVWSTKVLFEGVSDTSQGKHTNLIEKVKLFIVEWKIWINYK